MGLSHQTHSHTYFPVLVLLLVSDQPNEHPSELIIAPSTGPLVDQESILVRPFEWPERNKDWH